MQTPFNRRIDRRILHNLFETAHEPLVANCRKPLAAAGHDGERLILGIESSCDDTAAAVVSSSGRVLGESLAGQQEVHAPWGGVVPKLAMEAHQAAIDRVVDEALERAGVQPQQLDAVAVTIGPGLSLCLKVQRALLAVHAVSSTGYDALHLVYRSTLALTAFNLSCALDASWHRHVETP